MYEIGKLMEGFYWLPIGRQDETQMTDSEKYQLLVQWASKARGQNPDAFDTVTEWILDDSQWGADKLKENNRILMEGILARFKEQNAQIRALLLQIAAPGVVNAAVFEALDRFDDELSGQVHDNRLRETVGQVFLDFSVMENRGIRERFGGNKNGPTGTDTVEIFGYLNYLKDCDAGVQWALFMPEVVEKQQSGFRVESFEYRKMPAMRFIGREGGDLQDLEARRELFHTLDAMADYRSGFDSDLFLMHHNGLGVDVGPWHGFWGRFMKADAPVPEGFSHFDFIPQNDGRAGPPFVSQFAFAVFTGDREAMHKREGFDSDSMYDVTRNIMLGQGVHIPYPDKYWTAEVFLEGYDKYGTAYLFSAAL